MVWLVGMLLAVLLLLSTAQSIYFFIVKMKLSFIKWFFFNACAPSNILFLVGFIVFFLFKTTTLLYAAILPVFFFGFWGLTLFSWQNPFSQLGHIVMLLNVLWVVLLMIQTKDYKPAAVGFLLGILLFSIFIGLQQNYIREHWQEFKQVMPVRQRRVSE